MKKILLMVGVLVMLSGCATLGAMVDDYCAKPSDERWIEVICSKAD